MKRTHTPLVVAMSIVLVLLAVTAVIATPIIVSTPLFTYRMEKESGSLNFLPTKINGFTYSAEKGCTVSSTVSGFYGVKGPGTYGSITCKTAGQTCGETCVESCNTCETCTTCSSPCTVSTCRTCVFTCPLTCTTCQCNCPIYKS